MEDITHAVLAERITDLKQDLTEIKSEMKEQRMTMQTVLVQMASMGSVLQQNHDDISEVNDRLLMLERPPAKPKRQRSNLTLGAIVTAVLAVLGGLVELIRKH